MEYDNKTEFFLFGEKQDDDMHMVTTIYHLIDKLQQEMVSFHKANVYMVHVPDDGIMKLDQNDMYGFSDVTVQHKVDVFSQETYLKYSVLSEDPVYSKTCLLSAYNHNQNEFKNFLKAQHVTLARVEIMFNKNNQILGSNCMGEDFSYTKFKHTKPTVQINMKRINLRYTNFKCADLTNVDFTGSDVTGADFTNANMTGVKFDVSSFKGANFTGATLTNMYIISDTYADADYDEVNLRLRGPRVNMRTYIHHKESDSCTIM